MDAKSNEMFQYINIKERSKIGQRYLTEEEVEQVWQKAKLIEGLSGTIARLDPCEALIFQDHYLRDMSNYSWGIDHINPALRDTPEETIDNLRPMHLSNIESKGDDYPSYTGVVTSKGSQNMAIEREFRIRVKKENEE